jgi:hypothetical protein
MGKEDFRQSACTARPDGDPPEDAVRYTRGQLPGAKIGVRALMVLPQAADRIGHFRREN